MNSISPHTQPTEAVTPVEDRGSTLVPAKVIAQIAEQVASEVPNVGSGSGGFLGIGQRRDFESRPTVECDLYGRSAVLRVDVGVSFPVDVVSVMTELRQTLTRRVEHLTGVDVARIDIDISWLRPADTMRRLR